MRELIIEVLEEHKFLKTIELALQVWLRKNKREIPDIWEPTKEEHEEILKTERLLMLFLPQLKEEGLVDIDPDYKYVNWLS